MKKIQLAVLGLGARGTYVAGLFQKHPQCEIVAIAERHDQVAKRALGELKLQPWQVSVRRDMEELLRHDAFDAVLMAGNPMEQARIACLAMEAGRHVCTEVPAAFTIEDCHALVDTVEKTGCKYQLLEQTRHWGFIETWRQRHARGEFGHLALVQGEYMHYEPGWRIWEDPVTGESFGPAEVPAGRHVVPTWRQVCFADPIYYLPHTISPLLSIVGGRVTRVSCMGTKPSSYDKVYQGTAMRDVEYALMHTDGDTIMLVGAGFTMPQVHRGPASSHWYELRGTRGSVTSPRYEDDAFRRWGAGDATYQPEPLSLRPLNASDAQAQTGHGGADFLPVDNFIEAILNDTTPSLDVYSAAELTAPAIVAAASARLGGVLLDVPDFRQKAKA